VPNLGFHFRDLQEAKNPGLFSRKETEQQGAKWKRGPRAKEKEEIIQAKGKHEVWKSKIQRIYRFSRFIVQNDQLKDKRAQRKVGFRPDPEDSKLRST